MMIADALESGTTARPVALQREEESELMKDLLLPIGILIVWYVMNAWVLPKFGVKT